MLNKNIKGSHFAFLHATLLLYAIASIMAKFAGQALNAKDYASTILFIVAEFFLLGIYSLFWQQVLKRMPLNFAYTNKAICTLWSFLFGILFFGENFTLQKGIGLAVVLVGIGLVVSDDV